MIVFINDHPLRLLNQKRATRLIDPLNHPAQADFDRIIDARLDALKPETLHGHLLILNATPATVEKLLALFQKTPASSLLSITLGCPDKDACETALMRPFKIIKAAGGVVIKDSRLLMMFRRGVWDLPKGKLDDGESSRGAAAREVEEETGVRVTVNDRICTTWHTYSLNGNRILKRTKWYRMQVIDDRKMAPQQSEDIEKLAWLDLRQTQKALTNSFSSIRFVIDELVKSEEVNR